jgi:SlyX protein
MDDTLEQRLVTLESRLAHHERMAEETSDVLAEQAGLIDRLTREVRRLKERLGEVEAGWDRSPQDDKPPPHY